MSGRYARQIALADFGAEGQAKLARGRVLIVGMGGLGCPAALYLATSGVGRLVLNDFDSVDETNLPRQILFAPEDVGALKVDAAKRRLTALNPAVEIVTVSDRLDSAALEAAVGGVDVVLDGTDNFATRFVVNRACVARGVPLVSGAAVRVEGQVAVFTFENNQLARGDLVGTPATFSVERLESGRDPVRGSANKIALDYGARSLRMTEAVTIGRS